MNSILQNQSTQTLDNHDLLQRYLQDRDVYCPDCDYNLCNLTSAHCPECGYHLQLYVTRTNPNIKAFIFGTINLSLAYAIPFLVLILCIILTIIPNGGRIWPSFWLYILTHNLIFASLLFSWCYYRRRLFLIAPILRALLGLLHLIAIPLSFTIFYLIMTLNNIYHQPNHESANSEFFSRIISH